MYLSTLDISVQNVNDFIWYFFHIKNLKLIWGS